MNYKPNEKTKCVECGKDIHEDDKYYWAKQRGKNGKVNFMHEECYQKLLPKKQ